MDANRYMTEIVEPTISDFGGVTVKNEHDHDLLEIVKGAAEFVRARIKS
jgi:hypothetical protein